MTEPTNTLPEPYQSGRLKPCPFCGRNMKYTEMQWTFEWDVFIVHEYNKSVLYNSCPMAFCKHIPWKDRVTGEVFDEDVISRHKQAFIDSWNRRAQI